ncbi:MAG: antigen, partial [uncultured Cytophagales bacterium]
AHTRRKPGHQQRHRPEPGRKQRQLARQDPDGHVHHWRPGRKHGRGSPGPHQRHHAGRAERQHRVRGAGIRRVHGHGGEALCHSLRRPGTGPDGAKVPARRAPGKTRPSPRLRQVALAGNQQPLLRQRGRLLVGRLHGRQHGRVL